MDLTRELFRLALLGAINHQVTYIVNAGSIFADFRTFCGRCSPKLGELVACNLCLGTWVGFVMAFVFQPRLVQPGPPPAGLLPPARWRRVVGFFADAFAIALAGRFFTEVLAILRFRAAVAHEQQELLEERLQRARQPVDRQQGETLARPQ